MENKFKYPHMFTPITIRGVTYKNRVWTAPTGAQLLCSGEPYPNEAMIAHYREKARGGAACITFSGQNVDRLSPEHDKHRDQDIYDERFHTYWYRLTSTIHFFGAKASLELLAFSHHGHSENGEASCMYSVSGEEFEGSFIPQMPECEMECIVDNFALAAKHAVAVGFDMVLLHFGHGTLPARFLSPYSNRRTDEYGGSAENRARFPIMIIDAVREAVGPRVPIEVRLSGDELIEGGGKVSDCVEFLRLVEKKIDIAHISCGTMVEDITQTRMHPVEFYQPGCNVEFASAVKKSGIKLPVLTLGAFQTPELVEEVLSSGKADIVAMARGTIADAACVNKAKIGREEEIIPCIKCFYCLEHDDALEFACSANPRIGREYALDQLIPALSESKRLAVIGGGPAGMAGAIYAAERGHDVTLFEKSTELGGKLTFARHADFKYSLNNYLQYQLYMVKKLGIKVRLGVKATPEMIVEENYDVVFAAVGSDPVILPIQGNDRENVLTAEQCFGRLDALGQRIVVIGGGEVGCETAIYLAQSGKDVCVLEMLPELAASSAYANYLTMNDRVTKCCKTFVNARCSAIMEDSVSFVDLSDGTQHSVPADTVVFSVGMRAREELAESFRFCAPVFFRLGDCEVAKNVRICNRTAFDAAMQI